jgi:hypothetical protein
MAIDLSTLTFTNQADIVPASGTDQIINTGIANTLGGNDRITGTSTNTSYFDNGIDNDNSSSINTGIGNDIITGSGTGLYSPSGIRNLRGSSINTGTGNDTITGTATLTFSAGGQTGIARGFYNTNSGSTDTGDGDDIITATGTGRYWYTGGPSAYGIANDYSSSINTGSGNDIITATGTVKRTEPYSHGVGIANNGSVIDTGSGNDKITATGTGTSGAAHPPSDSDPVFGYGWGIVNILGSSINTGDGNDTITVKGGLFNDNSSSINTGVGNDIITGTGTGSNGVSPLVGSGFGYCILNNGQIDTGSGCDIIDARKGGFGGDGLTRLGDGKDIVKGFGSGSFNGGSGCDRLKLTTGTYTVGISGSNVNFSKSGVVMNTTQFEQLIAGSATYSFGSLTNGQVITV